MTMAEDSLTAFNFQKLGSDNYIEWQFSMQMYLTAKSLWEIVTGEETVAVGASEDDKLKFKKRHNLAFSALGLGVKKDLQIYVRNSKTAKEAWDALENHFEEKTLSKIILYRRKLYSARMLEGKSMTDHLNNLKTIAEHLEALEDPVRERELVMILLSSLPEEYNN